MNMQRKRSNKDLGMEIIEIKQQEDFKEQTWKQP